MTGRDADDKRAARFIAVSSECLLDWHDARTSHDPHATKLDFARAVFRHGCAVCDWGFRAGGERGGQAVAFP